jgi:hypothetical protein
MISWESSFFSVLEMSKGKSSVTPPAMDYFAVILKNNLTKVENKVIISEP